MALDEWLTRHSPEKKTKRPEERKRVARPRKTLQTAESSRHIPPSVRDAVFSRDKGRCAYVGTSGERCGSTHHLQIDHVVPYARGGTSTIDNLRLLCARHNKIEAERLYGVNAITRRISAVR
jgi:5-methylcytosine-specific restriction endonuclease McrA